MRSKSLKKVLAVTLAATMVMASAITVCASGSNTGDTGTTTTSSSSESSSAPVTYAESKTVTTSTPVSVAGTSMKSTVAGVFAAEKVQGCVITTPAANLAAALNLGSGMKAKVVIYDTDAKKSNLAMACVDAAIQSLGGGEMVAALNVDLGATSKGKWVALSDGSVAMATGLPKGADTTKTYCVVCVQPGGVVTILEDQDTNPKTVTFAVQAGLGTYALVAK